MYELNVVEETVTLGGGERRLARTKVIRINKIETKNDTSWRHEVRPRRQTSASDLTVSNKIGRREKEIRGTRNRNKHRRHDARGHAASGRLGRSRGVTARSIFIGECLHNFSSGL